MLVQETMHTSYDEELKFNQAYISYNESKHALAEAQGEIEMDLNQAYVTRNEIKQDQPALVDTIESIELDQNMAYDTANTDSGVNYGIFQPQENEYEDVAEYY